MLVQQIRDIIVDINGQGTEVLLIEQNANMALSIADYGYIMETGKVVMDGDPQKLLKDEDVQEFYLGLHGEGEPQVLPRREALQAAEAVAVVTVGKSAVARVRGRQSFPSRGSRRSTESASRSRNGELFAIIGPNGAGKTSTFNCLNGVYQPAGGRHPLGG